MRPRSAVTNTMRLNICELHYFIEDKRFGILHPTRRIFPASTLGCSAALLANTSIRTTYLCGFQQRAKLVATGARSQRGRLHGLIWLAQEGCSIYHKLIGRRRFPHCLSLARALGAFIDKGCTKKWSCTRTIDARTIPMRLPGTRAGRVHNNLHSHALCIASRFLPYITHPFLPAWTTQNHHDGFTTTQVCWLGGSQGGRYQPRQRFESD